MNLPQLFLLDSLLYLQVLPARLMPISDRVQHFFSFSTFLRERDQRTLDVLDPILFADCHCL